MCKYKENIIIWEKWKDPFGDASEEDIPDDGLGDFFDDVEDRTSFCLFIFKDSIISFFPATQANHQKY